MSFFEIVSLKRTLLKLNQNFLFLPTYVCVKIFAELFSSVLIFWLQLDASSEGWQSRPGAEGFGTAEDAWPGNAPYNLSIWWEMLGTLTWRRSQLHCEVPFPAPLRDWSAARTWNSSGWNNMFGTVLLTVGWSPQQSSLLWPCRQLGRMISVPICPSFKPFYQDLQKSAYSIIALHSAHWINWDKNPDSQSLWVIHHLWTSQCCLSNDRSSRGVFTPHFLLLSLA